MMAAADELGQLDELEGQADELERASVDEVQAPELKPDHRRRPDAYPDELDQTLCDVCETLCQPGGPCHCCWVEQLCEQDRDS